MTLLMQILSTDSIVKLIPYGIHGFEITMAIMRRVVAIEYHCYVYLRLEHVLLSSVDVIVVDTLY